MVAALLFQRQLPPAGGAVDILRKKHGVTAEAAVEKIVAKLPVKTKKSTHPKTAAYA